MPELPEVETVVRGLRLSLPGRSVLDVRFGKTDFVDDPAAIAEKLPGMRISDVTRMGKFICIALEPVDAQSAQASASRVYLIVHLGMTGRLTVINASESAPPHTHVYFGLDDGRELRYTDPRRFGRMLVIDETGLPAFAGNLGQEPLEVTAEDFCRFFASRRARLKALLLDQSILRGIGNIYADESLFRARLHPARIAENVTREQLLLLHQKIRDVLLEAIRSRGSSISDYVDSEGNRGDFQLRHRVYQRDGRPCYRCRATIRHMIVAGRSSHFCPRCQPAPRGGKPTRRGRKASVSNRKKMKSGSRKR